ncbi:hypothetical protein [Thalassotalea maritima]|uniref:hypothetical protein n=1 Tax=Thalassotalea maritima TaxID=3242416 RepID=UPI003527A31E
MKTISITVPLVIMTCLTACSTGQQDACEDVVYTAEQRQHCTSLQRQISNAKNNLIKRTELERRYQKDCIDIRYYRDDKTDQRCNNQTSVDEVIRKLQSSEQKPQTGAN